MKIEGMNAVTIGIWAVIIIVLFYFLRLTPYFFGAIFVIALVWMVIDKQRKKSGSSASPSGMPGASPM